jgi:phosphoadenosine phosphosulfate reductase
MQGLEVWITGIRREQSVTREETKLVEYDTNFSIIKLNPLVDWTEEEVWNCIKQNDIPYNSLYKENYRSIGCAPCTRAVSSGGSIRDGRWWWENPDTKECGLHFKTNQE